MTARRSSIRVSSFFVVFVAGLALLSAAPPAAGQTGAESGPLRVEDIFEVEIAGDPRISPDGRRVVYVRQRADIMTDSRFSNVWIVGSDGSGHRPLTTGDFNDSSPRWSPDGTRLAFISNRSGSAQIHVRWMDSGETSTITNVTEPPRSFAWSPDGTQIAFGKLVPTPAPTIGGMPTPPEGAQWAEPAQVVERLVYRFDQLGDLPHGFVHVFVVPSEGGTTRRITSGDGHWAGNGIGGTHFSWTPDGASLVMSRDPRGGDTESVFVADTEVFEVSVADGTATRLTDRRGPDDGPIVSPDGRHIAYFGMDDRFQGYQLTRLYVMNRDGSDPRSLSDGLDREVYGAAWTPDGSGLYALYDDEGMTKLALFRLDDDGSGHRVLTANVGGVGRAYAGATYSVADDGSFAMNYTTPAVISEVATGRPGSEVRVLTGINDDLMAKREIGEVEEIRYESSHDGRPIHGWIIKPPGFDPSREYPLILEIHGGPFSNYGARFDLEKQLMAAQGYVVLYTNPRGSTSYGEEFGNLIHHAYPGDDFYDLVSGVDAVIDRGYVDPGQLYVVGGSGGGVLTAWLVGRTDRFRAAVSWYPVINWYSFVLTADMAAYGVNYWFPGFPWDHVEHYESRSLLSVVENVTTPTRIVTGEEDWRTPMSESEQYFKALKLLGVETSLVRFPGEPHGIRRRPSHHIGKMLSTLEWFRRYSATTS
ncbi:prolyl oligopeptidase family serine peptidase [Candidatus Palauibacter sp.]|uniref:prolyl oligopeptidase family serine peptidase n=1 Tax=Candidatus Palauibacter sp. TaxID=3101350 RepID=UPI003B5236FB